MPKLVDRLNTESSDLLVTRIKSACRRIAPSWPLDQAIAVNPYVGFLDMSMREAATLLGFVAGSPMLMPLSWYGKHQSEAFTMPPMQCYSDLIDQRRTGHALTCRDVVTNAISQHCAAYFDRDQAQWQAPRESSLYQSWRDNLSRDPGPSLISGIPNIAEYIVQLPDCSEAAIALCLETLGISTDATELYLLCLLYRMNGWASWCAYLDRPADGYLYRKELLAICIGFEAALLQGVADSELSIAWYNERQTWKTFRLQPCSDRRWLLQNSIESAYCTDVHRLLRTPCASQVGDVPQVQAVFCIDVRSEVYRRSLESSGRFIETRGTAGFFGLPISYHPLGNDKPRPQVVPLIEPRFCVSDSTSKSETDRIISQRRRIDLSIRHLFSEWKRSAVSKFTFVESFGIFFALALFAKARNARRKVGTGVVGTSSRDMLKPRIVNLDEAQATSLAQSILRSMSFVKDFAPIVCIIGHESDTSNNPQASMLDCGACGGQSGAINAQAAAELLNRRSVRNGLLDRDIDIPDTTWFCAGVHNTSTDEVTLYDHEVPEDHRAQLAEFRSALSLAQTSARRERGSDRGVSAHHWANVRPEWGLARNAAMIIAPRTRTVNKSLDGRAFLQEYHYAEDVDGSVLRAVLGGPLIVAHWISMQYYASVVDPRRFGSGSKLLHNVVGGSIGIFEGNGGDLRIGISHQALHDGNRLVHTPMRLSAWIEAPRDRTAQEILGQDMVCRMIVGEWINVFNLDPSDNAIHRASVTSDESGSYYLLWQPIC